MFYILRKDQNNCEKTSLKDYKVEGTEHNTN